MTAGVEKRWVFFDWELSHQTESGVAARNLMKLSLIKTDYFFVSLCIEWHQVLPFNLFEFELLNEPVQYGVQTRKQIAAQSELYVTVNCPVLRRLDNTLLSSNSNLFNKHVMGVPNIGFAEIDQLGQNRRPFDALAADYAQIVTCSSWADGLLRAQGITNTKLVHPGVDVAQYHQAPRSNLFSDRFVIFVDGPLVARSGMDIALAAVSAFAKNRPDVLLVIAPKFEGISAISAFNRMAAGTPIAVKFDGQPDIAGWLKQMGLNARQFILTQPISELWRAQVLREADVVLVADRAHPGLNQTAMAAMACGVPVILADNTGNHDLADPDICYVLDQQKDLGDPNRPGWGISDPDQIVQALEQAYCDRTAVRERAARAAQKMLDYSWGHQIEKLAAVIAPLDAAV